MAKEKYLITGFSGFVSKHFIDFLEQSKIEAEIYGIDLQLPSFDMNQFKYVTCFFEQVNLIDEEQIKAVIQRVMPDYLLHLASFSSVAYSWREPSISFRNNTNIFLNILEVISELKLKCRILSVGSSEEYGNIKAVDLPLKEDHQLAPSSPYAVARVAQEMLSRVYVDGFGLDIIMTRSFNHMGPGQNQQFVVPGFIHKIMQAREQDPKQGTIKVGDTSIVRDFVDVRDVVRAYYLLFKRGKCGEVYNVCSGKGVKLSEVISTISEIVGMHIDPQVDDALIRPIDNPVMRGSYEKLKAATDWDPQITLSQTLKDMISFKG